MNFQAGIAGGFRPPAGKTWKDVGLALQDLGVGLVRYPLNRRQIQPTGRFRRRWNWSVIEDPLDRLQRWLPDMQVMVTLRNEGFRPNDINGYRKFVRAFVDRVGDRIDVLQPENEVDSRTWWRGTTDEYLALLQTASAVVRQRRPRLSLLAAGLTHEITEALSTRAVQNLTVTALLQRAADMVDAMDVHCYGLPESVTRHVNWMRDMVGVSKPIWITEMGGPDILYRQYSDELQVSEVIDRVDGARSSGAERYCWTGLYPSPDTTLERWQVIPLCDKAGHRKPAFRAYQDAIHESP
jgi:hypothetical protein